MVLENYLPTEKQHCFQIETAYSSRLKELERELKVMKKAYSNLQEEVVKFKCLNVVHLCIIPSHPVVVSSPEGPALIAQTPSGDISRFS